METVIRKKKNVEKSITTAELILRKQNSRMRLEKRVLQKA